MSVDAVTGYRDLGGRRIWSIRGYGGGSVGRWAADIVGESGMWDAFNANITAFGEPEALWWQLCTLNAAPGDGLDAALLVWEAVRSRLPGAQIYVSAQPEYSPAGSCDIAGPDGPAFMADVAGQLVQQGVAAGPVNGPLRQAETIDGCHANGSGQLKLGQQLLSFFG